MSRRALDPKIVKKARRLTEAGFSLAEISEFLEIPARTFTRWRDTYAELGEALAVDPIIESKKRLMNRVGCSTYRPKFNDMAYKHCLLGATNDNLAAFFDVDTETIRRWQNKYLEFARAIHDGKREADAKVAASLYHRAVGYSHDATYLGTYKGKIISEGYTKHYPPDPTSAIFWLKNRDSANWRDKREIVVEDADELTPWSAIGDDTDGETEN